ncbi:DUF3551 domain-containing protein [Afipia birgiae]|jgi:hypothetical protein|uniref:DUF3551 domain-containing protein n=1 Tax=Afipia birgiae TaxID=151414 RepID=UPI0002F8DA1C|nr:DUF3551 domain-containing protein [Afipia birgiae]MBX9820269.1 DUF3551 domain-containing protein [Afipia birgiae]
MIYPHRTMLALAGLLLFGQAPAQAIDYPYCMTYVQGWSGSIEQCDYTSMAQCQASAGGLNGSCAPNWRLTQNRSVYPDAGAPRSKRNQR